MPAAAHSAPFPNLLTYERRDPSAGPLHQLLGDRLEAYLEARGEGPLPGFVAMAAPAEATSWPSSVSAAPST